MLRIMDMSRGKIMKYLVAAVFLLACILTAVCLRHKDREVMVKLRYDGETYIGKEDKGGEYDYGLAYLKNDVMVDSMAFDSIPNGVMTADGAATPMEEDGGAKSFVADSILAAHGEMIAYTYDYSAESTEYDALTESLFEALSLYGGYLEDSSVDTAEFDSLDKDTRYKVRKGYYTMRVPAENVPKIRKLLYSDTENIFTENVCMEDETAEYLDAEAYLKALEMEYKRLEELLPQAENVSEIIEVQDRLKSVNYEMESYKKQMERITEDVRMSTVYLTLYEVLYYEAAIQEYIFAFGSRMADAFEEFMVMLPAFLFGMIFLLIAGAVIIFLVSIGTRVVIAISNRTKAERVIRIVQSGPVPKG